MELTKQAEAADFLATVSHEIRTPMNGVLGMLHMLMDTDLDANQQDYVRTAQDSGKALVSLINEVLDQAKIESGKIELEAMQFDLRAIMDDVLALFSGKAHEKGIEVIYVSRNVLLGFLWAYFLSLILLWFFFTVCYLNFKFSLYKLVGEQLAVYVSDGVPEMLIGDPGRFRQIITNLMGNSIKEEWNDEYCALSLGFTKKGHIFLTVHPVEEVMDSIDVETESSSLNTLSGLPIDAGVVQDLRFSVVRAQVITLPPSSSDLINLIVSVEDTGVGIPLEAQPRVYTPFMQCLVGLMNGEIGFVSIPDIGSTFTFTAVFSNGCSNSNDTKQQKQRIKNQCNTTPSEFQDMTALVVDPKPVRASVSRYQIQRLGIHVELVSDLNQAMKIEFSKWSLLNRKFGIRTSSISAHFVNNLQKIESGVSPKLFLLGNSLSSSRTSTATSGAYTLSVITKPLKARMLAASLQRAMGGNRGNPRNGEHPSLSLCNHLDGRKILIVDDNKVNLIVAAAALKKYGAKVICADSGKKAIKLLKPPHQFDACFMDIQMPEMDGFEATRRIRDMESNGRIPKLAMTADVIQATYEECQRCGMDGSSSTSSPGLEWAGSSPEQ
ncbi:LOW QUALITY PROTEIN: histidine kinase 3 isoform X4 [Populus alba x Populus x berolinensis]|nr:LOW QUALITY PROTEIN: histidine kinase 3 isoform X4 [Populus alba x Populus x berolinensis]